jgi:hypothetical protein
MPRLAVESQSINIHGARDTGNNSDHAVYYSQEVQEAMVGDAVYEVVAGEKERVLGPISVLRAMLDPSPLTICTFIPADWFSASHLV